MWQRLPATLALLAIGLPLLQPASADAPAEPVAMRLESRAGADRVRFEWRRIVDYTVERRGDAVTIAFREAAAFDGADETARASALIRAVVRRADAAGSEVTLILVPEARVRYFRKGVDVIVDVMAPAPAPAAPAGATLAASTLR